MRELSTKLSSKNQVTVPAEVRRELCIGPHDRMSFVIEDGVVTVRPPAFTLESAFGSVEPLPATSTDDFDNQIRQAMEDHADDVVTKLRRS